ncbi:tetratricopeptide repeat protein [Terrarubrum flagellatum]|uniref:tetratricopeptide repeat protein n=1 Tax=Terrirubrum flagellatum TaxID=2895980 RepID=UPI003144D81D
MSRMALLVAVSCLAATAAVAQTPPSDSGAAQETIQSQKPATDADRADAEKRAAEARAAIEACDKGASPPAYPGAKEKPVNSFHFLSDVRANGGLQALWSSCAAAVAAEPDNARLRYELARVSLFLSDDSRRLVIPAIRQFADAGVADAQYLAAYMTLYRLIEPDADPSLRAQAGRYLRAAADSGHLAAVLQLVAELSKRPRPAEISIVDYAPREAVALARKWGGRGAAPLADDNDDAKFRDWIASLASSIALSEEGFTDDERAAAFAEIKAAVEAQDARNLMPYLQALREGRGTQKDAAEARRLIEIFIRNGFGHAATLKVMLAGMLMTGEGGAQDIKRAYDLVKSDDTRYIPARTPLLARILLSDTTLGRRPHQAMEVLSAGLPSSERSALMADLILRTDLRPQNDAALLRSLEASIELGERNATFLLGRLAQKFGKPYRDSEKLVEALRKLSDAGDLDAKTLYAALQIVGLDSGSQPTRRANGLSNDAIKALVDEGIKQNHPAAYLLAGKLLRSGILYAQDDRLATASFVKAATLGDIEAMNLAAKAYDDGLGVEKNSRERLRWWREAARRGSIEAMESLGGAFTFDFFDKLMTLQEGVTLPVSLYLEGLGSRFGDRGLPRGFGGDAIQSAQLGSLFSGSRLREAGAKAVALAVLDAFRMSPGGLGDEKIVALGRALPANVKLEIERELKQAGVFTGQPDGFFGPEMRRSLPDYVEAKGVLNEETLLASLPGAKPAATALSAQPDTQTRPSSDTDSLSKATLDAARDRAFSTAEKVAQKAGRERQDAVRMLNTMARYGDLPARWLLLRSYHRAQDVRAVVSPEEIVRYGLDVMISKPQGAEKADFEYIFTLGQIFTDRKMAAFARAFLAAVRDDSRLQDPLTLGGITQQLIMAPAACDAVADEARRAGVAGMGSEGCDETSRQAIIAYAKAKGPAGIDVKAREAAAADVRRLAEVAPAKR